MTGTITALAVMELGAKLLKMNEVEMGKKGLIKFNIVQLVCHLIC